MSLSDLSKELDARKQTSTKEQPYAMGRQTVRKARTDLTNKSTRCDKGPKEEVSKKNLKMHIKVHPIQRESVIKENTSASKEKGNTTSNVSCLITFLHLRAHFMTMLMKDM